jgi:hypothetical protein
LAVKLLFARKKKLLNAKCNGKEEAGGLFWGGVLLTNARDHLIFDAVTTDRNMRRSKQI